MGAPRGYASGCVTHSPEAQLFELRTGRGGPTSPLAYPRGAPTPSTLLLWIPTGMPAPLSWGLSS